VYNNFTLINNNFSNLGNIFIPESATRSVVSRPWIVKASFSWVRLKAGFGSLSLARVRFAVKLSLLPNGTFQSGPWACKLCY